MWSISNEIADPGFASTRSVTSDPGFASTRSVTSDKIKINNIYFYFYGKI